MFLKSTGGLSPSKKESFADPFVVKHKSSLYILFENYQFKANKANISAISLNMKHEVKNIQHSLQKPHHLSYPFVFKHNDEIYMIPCEWETKRVTLYKAKNFPQAWEEVSVLLESIAAIDTTLLEYNNMWWLFCTNKENEPDLKLFIYHSKDLIGPWHPHKQNPVKTDITSARPAGNIFKYKNSLIRPSQDSSKKYGGRIILNKVIKLTSEEFYEEPIKFIEPCKKSSFNKGIHTLSIIDETIIADSKRNLLSSYTLRKNIRKKIFSISSKKPKYSFIRIPKFIERKEYLNAINKIVELLKTQSGIISIYKMGSINHPGISDIDIFVVFDDNEKNTFNPNDYFKGILRYLFTHNIGAISKSHFNVINKYSFFHNITHLWGEKVSQTQVNLKQSELELLQFQTALEFLVSNFIDLSIQLKYGVIKLRMLLQHIKAIRYDLEFLKVTSGALYKHVYQLLDWMDKWFENPVDLKEFCEWIDKYYIELKNFLIEQTKEIFLYLPEWANTKLSHNIKIELGKSFTHKFIGFRLPKFITRINRKTFNLNNNINLFTFKIPYDFVAKDKILEARTKHYIEIIDCVSEHFPNFTPLLPGFIVKII